MDDQAVIRTYGNTNLPEGTADRPLVTFALFAYNQEKYIREAVEGAFSQTYSPLEIILSDDCSSDRTFEIMEEMAREYQGPHLVHISRNRKNLGLSAHINTIALLVRGDFVVLAAGDDVSHRNRAEKMTEAWLASGRRVLAWQSGYRDIDETSTFISFSKASTLPQNDVIELFAEKNLFIVGATGAYDRRLFSEFPPLNSQVVHEDRILPFRALLLGGEVGSINEMLVDYRRNVGISAAYRFANKIEPSTFSHRVLHDNIQKMIDAQHVGRNGIELILAANLRRYSSEVFAAQAVPGLSTLFKLIRRSGLFWGCRAYAKYHLRSHRLRY